MTSGIQWVSTVYVKMDKEARTMHARYNTKDKEAVKEARDTVFNESMPMGLVARKACQMIVEQHEAENNDNSDVRL